MKNPASYVHSNIAGLVNVLDVCKSANPQPSIVWASSSSVYGLNSKVPFSEKDRTDQLASLYAATKKAGEEIAHTYNHIYGLSTTGLRFFTVYGPWGRPNMAYFFFTKDILKGKAITIFEGSNHASVARDFTYIDDIVKGCLRALDTAKKSTGSDGKKKVQGWGIGWVTTQPDSIALVSPLTLISSSSSSPPPASLSPTPPLARERLSPSPLVSVSLPRDSSPSPRDSSSSLSLATHLPHPTTSSLSPSLATRLPRRKNSISGSGDSKEDQELQLLIYLITFRTDKPFGLTQLPPQNSSSSSVFVVEFFKVSYTVSSSKGGVQTSREIVLEGMHVFRATTALRSIAKWHQHGGERLTGLRSLTAGPDFMASGAGTTTGSMQLQIVDALRLGERRRASNLLLDFGYRSHSLRADDFVDIFNYCARSPDPLFVMEIWRLMEARDISLNNICFFHMIQALCKGGYLDEAFNMMNFLRESQRLYPVLSLYNSFLSACSKMQSITHASKCLDLMENQMVGKNEVTYTQLLKVAVLQKNLSAVHQMWEEYIKHYSMSIIALRKFIWSFTRLGDLTSAFKALQQMVCLANRGNNSIDSKFDGKLYSTRLDIPVPSNGELHAILDMEENKQWNSCTCPPSLTLLDANSASLEQQSYMGYEEAKSADMGRLNEQKHTAPVMKTLRWSFSDVIHACAQCQNYELAEQLILQMQNLGLQPSSHTYDGFVRAVVSQRGFNDGLEVLKVMRQKNLKPYDSALATLSVSCSEALELDLAEALLDQISECPHPYPYNAFLASCDTTNQPERALRILAKMKQMKILPDIRTYELLFSLFSNVNAPYEKGNMMSQVDAAKRINAIESDMARNDIHHDYLSMKSLLKALGEEGMIREMIQYLHVAENLFIHRNPSLGTAMYNIVLHSLVEAKECHMAIEIFKKMKLSGFQLDAATYNIMIDCCSILRCFKSASLLVSIMIREGFYPETLTYTALIKILLEEENFNEALNLLDHVRSDGKQLDVLLFNTILQRACDKGRIDIIEFIVKCMHQQKIQPDPATCSYVFCAYVNSGFHNTAIQALQVLSMRMMGEDVIKEKKEFVDEFILSEDSCAESQILKLFEESEENIAVAVALLNLRWCAIAGFPMCGSADRSLWAKRLELL